MSEDEGVLAPGSCAAKTISRAAVAPSSTSRQVSSLPRSSVRHGVLALALV